MLFVTIMNRCSSFYYTSCNTWIFMKFYQEIGKYSNVLKKSVSLIFPYYFWKCIMKIQYKFINYNYNKISNIIWQKLQSNIPNSY